MAVLPLSMLDRTSGAFVDAAHAAGIGRGRALAVYRAAFRLGICEVPWAQIESHPILQHREKDGTIKFLLRHSDGLETESVILPMHHRGGRTTFTLCVSSQIGCALGCEFCETAQMGLMKNLTGAQIVGQWFTARHKLGAPIRNIVFMGMGEPMDNLDAVIGAIEVLCDRNGAGIAPADIAVSTVGRIEGIDRLIEFASREGFRKLKLAVSVNAPNDSIRSRLMPVNRAEPMDRLLVAMRRWAQRCSPVLVEYVLIPGVNDRVGDADELCTYLKSLDCTVNVIPYNPRRDSPWPAPPETAVARFVERIRLNGQFVTRRRTLGRSVMAGCGQLGNEGIRRRRFVCTGADNSPDRQLRLS